MEVESRPIESLTLDPDNRRLHSKESIKAIAESLRNAKQQTPIVITKKGLVVKGNGTLQAAQSLGWKSIDCVVTKLGGRALKAYKIADNRTGELSEWDTEGLLEDLQLLEQAQMLEATGYDTESLMQLLEAQRGEKPDIVDEDIPPEPPVEATTAKGDIWLLGNHRVLCGDSTDQHDVAKVLGDAKPFLMVTDPPYGVNYNAEWRKESGLTDNGAFGKVTNDDKHDWSAAYDLFPGDVAYVWHASVLSPEVAASLENSGFIRRNLIIWAKSSMVIGRGNYHHQFEPLWYSVRKGAPNARFTESRSETTLFKNIDDNLATGELVFLARDEAKKVYAIRGNTSCLWQIPKPSRSETGHSTQKPVECMWRPIRNHKCNEVYDPFLGSGTTVIAAEQLGRTCYGIELERAYCDVIVMRYEAFTGREAILESTGKKFSEVRKDRSKRAKAKK